VTVKQAIATWLVNRDVYWPLADNAPWFILTHYPQFNDSFSWLDGVVILMFIAAAAAIVGGAIFAGLWLADRVLPAFVRPGVRDADGSLLRSPLEGVHKLAQGLIPAAGAGVFLGLSATTLTLLQHEGVPTGWANPARFTLLTLALAWSLRFQWRLAGLRTPSVWRRAMAVMVVAAGMVPFVWSWVLLFVKW
jgi:hypothetical protein